jgi:hypothetical protein
VYVDFIQKIWTGEMPFNGRSRDERDGLRGVAWWHRWGGHGDIWKGHVHLMVIMHAFFVFVAVDEQGGNLCLI